MDEMSLESCVGLLESELVAHIGVSDDDGPYVTPVSYVIIETRFFFRSGPGRRLRAVGADPRVCVEVSRHSGDGGSWESVVGFGPARLVDDDSLAQTVVQRLFSKYQAALGSPLTRGGSRPLPEPGVIVCVELEDITGRSSGSWFSIPTRPGRL